jgi:hypothetical protein
MSTPMPPNRSLKPGPFTDRLVAFLMPYWAGVTKDYDLARADVEETIAAYGARTRAELINAVQIIANSFAALEMLAQVKLQEPQLTPAEHLRYRGAPTASAAPANTRKRRSTSAWPATCPRPRNRRPNRTPMSRMRRRPKPSAGRRRQSTPAATALRTRSQPPCQTAR